MGRCNIINIKLKSSRTVINEEKYVARTRDVRAARPRVFSSRFHLSHIAIMITVKTNNNYVVSFLLYSHLLVASSIILSLSFHLCK